MTLPGWGSPPPVPYAHMGWLGQYWPGLLRKGPNSSYYTVGAEPGLGQYWPGLAHTGWLGHMGWLGQYWPGLASIGLS